MFHISTKSVTFSGGDVIEIPRNGILLITGPNNSGKSSTLEAIHRRYDLRHTYRSAISASVDSVELRIDGTVDDFVEYLKETYEYDKEDDVIIFDSGYSRDLKLDTHRQRFESGELPNQVLNDLTLRLTARERLENSRDEGISAVANLLFSDEEKEKQISAIFRTTFFEDVLLDRTRERGRFKVADRKKTPKRLKIFSPAARKYFEALPDLSDQGDGMRSFARILLEVMAGDWHAIILDEPELFLHPPQIRQLARFIAQDTPADTQIVIATHSAQFVQGLVDHASERLEVVRLTRTAKGNSARKLDAATIKQLWSDPVVGASGALDALFHDAAVLCEGDSDLKFFRAMMPAVTSPERGVDVEFFHAGGKDRIIPLVDALKHLGILVCAIVDIDVLADIDKFRKIYSAFGGQNDTIEGDLRIIHDYVRQKKTQITGDYFCSRLEELSLAAKGQVTVPKDVTKEIYGLLKTSSPWGAIKEQGVSYFPGRVHNAAQKLLESCAALGLFIVPEGELEGFCRTSNRSSKSAWLSETLERDLSNDPNLAVARAYLGAMMDHIKAEVAGKR